jgi:hypothetical protein
MMLQTMVIDSIHHTNNINLCSERGQSPLFVASQQGHCDVVKCLLSSGADINVCDKDGRSPLFIASHQGHCDELISEPELSKHLTTSTYPFMNVRNNGDCPHLSDKLITAPELSKHLTTSQCPCCDATNNGDCPSL